jgi:hypothetical protein
MEFHPSLRDKVHFRRRPYAEEMGTKMKLGHGSHKPKVGPLHGPTPPYFEKLRGRSRETYIV